MSQPVKLPAIFSGLKSRKDRSFRLEFDTRELGTDAAPLLAMQQSECWLVIAPSEDAVDRVDIPNYKADAGVNQKTPGQRLRAVLFVLWNQQGRPGDTFDSWYSTVMERLIDGYKAKLDGDMDV
jgi:hypothetical protein